MEHQEHILKNGLRVILIDTQAFPTLTTLLLVGAGSRYENMRNNGIAHFFEHMALKASKKYPNSFVVASTIEGLGGVFNAYTSKDHTGYWIKATTEHFRTMLDVLSDTILEPLLREEEIEREKGVIIQEINMYEDRPQEKVAELFETLLYDGNPLGFDVVGKKDTVSQFTRQTFVDYMRQLYHPKNAVLIVAGGLNQIKNEKLKIKNYLKIIEEKFGSWTGGEKACFEKVIESQAKPQSLIRHKKTEQTHFCLGFRAFSLASPKKYALSLIASILGGGMSSRLFIEVREKRGLTYYIATGRSLYQDVGSIITQAGVANDLGKLKQAIDVTLKEHQKIAKGDVGKDELGRAKEYLKGRLLLSMEDSLNVANFYGTRKILEDQIETPKQLIERIEKVKLDELAVLAQEIFRPQNLNFSLIGPFEERDLRGLITDFHG